MSKIICKHKIPAQKQYISLLSHYLQTLSENMGFAEEACDNLAFGFKEVCKNIVQHAYDGNTEYPIQVEFHQHKNRIEIWVRDYGKQVPPGSMQSQDLGEYDTSGLGLHVVDNIMDGVHYSPFEKKGSLLKMIKYLPKNLVKKDKAKESLSKELNENISSKLSATLSVSSKQKSSTKGKSGTSKRIH